MRFHFHFQLTPAPWIYYYVKQTRSVDAIGSVQEESSHYIKYLRRWNLFDLQISRSRSNIPAATTGGTGYPATTTKAQVTTNVECIPKPGKETYMLKPMHALQFILTLFYSKHWRKSSIKKQGESLGGMPVYMTTYLPKFAAPSFFKAVDLRGQFENRKI